MKRLLLLLLLPLLAQAAEPEVRVRSQLLPAEGVLVGGTLTLQVDLLVDTWFDAAPNLPPLKLEGAVVSAPSSEGAHLNERIDGKAFFGLRLSYQITPQQAKAFDIPALAIEVTPGQGSGPVKVYSQAQHFVARQPAGGGQGQHLVARQVRFTQQLEYAHQPLRVGDSVTRRVQVQAEDAQAMLIPAPTFADIEGLRRYLQTPVVAPLSDGRGGVSGGRRDDAVTYVVTEAGHYRLPAIELKWWDAESGEARTATLPALELEASGPAAYQAPFSIRDDLRALGQGARVQVAGHWLLIVTAALVVGVIGYLGRGWSQMPRDAWRRWRARRRQAWLASAAYAWRQVPGQLAQQPPQLGALYLWLRRATGCREMNTGLGALPVAVSKCLLAFLRARYGVSPQDTATTSQLMEALPALRRAVDEHTRPASPRHGLKKLNP
ncbi:hypothetical protein NJF44_07280 [Pseudomonas guariconensis]|uniref:hypothetical protein n=1 Tax=Pseudomonas TaxID=286 RepID=UPI0020972207|nr:MULTISPECIES: hypothetical protein [Pseudomonas]MCO7515168.1 hypothetical protein [Pseudomonas putida]MCO7605045.1 hypothetical protein [Pseudomonas guariconensis]